jgi:hypothetical protein
MSKAESHFLEGQIKIGDLKIRPLTAGSSALMAKLKSPFLGAGDAKELKTDEQLEEAGKYLWVHTQPEEEVVRSVLDGSAREKVLIWLMSVPLQTLMDATPKIEEAIAAGLPKFEIENKPDHKPEDAPPNS